MMIRSFADVDGDDNVHIGFRMTHICLNIPRRTRRGMIGSSF